MGKAGELKLNLPGINVMMRDDVGLQKVLQANAESIAQTASQMSGEKYAAGVEYQTDERRLRWIAVATVFPETPEAHRDNLRNNTLAKAGGASGLRSSKGGK